jgi:hypothetical protein
MLEESIQRQDETEDPVKLNISLQANKLLRFPLFVSESNVMVINVPSSLQTTVFTSGTRGGSLALNTLIKLFLG